MAILSDCCGGQVSPKNTTALQYCKNKWHYNDAFIVGQKVLQKRKMKLKIMDNINDYIKDNIMDYIRDNINVNSMTFTKTFLRKRGLKMA